MAIFYSILRLMVISIVVSLSYSLRAQTQSGVNSNPEPAGGLNKLGMEFLKINFTPPQRAILDNVQLELLFSVDSTGKAALEDVNGITDGSIMDSLHRTAARLPLFNPAREEGHAVEGLYSMMLQYPRYTRSRIDYGLTPRRYRKLTLEDFEEYQLGGRMDALIGGMMNSFTGTAHEYLSTGGGFKVDLSFSGKNGYGGGLAMSFYGNERKKDYPIDPSRTQDKESFTLLIGPVLSKTFTRTDRTSWMVQFEPAYAQQNISSKINNQDKEYVAYKGFSPGITFHYMLRLGKEHFIMSNGPALFGHYVNFHGGIRPLFYNSSAGSGVMFEVGVSYRMVYRFFESYVLKE
jgi:hypothetical protein